MFLFYVSYFYFHLVRYYNFEGLWEPILTAGRHGSSATFDESACQTLFLNIDSVLWSFFVNFLLCFFLLF